MSKSRIVIGLIGSSIILLLIGAYWYHYHDINKTIRKGSAYGFQIGESKKETFLRIASNPKVRWVDISYVSYRIDGSRNDEQRHLEDVAEEFSDWVVWRIYGLDPENKIIGLSFESWQAPNNQPPTLQFMWRGEELYIGWENERLSVLSPSKKGDPSLRLGMSYPEVYDTLIRFNTLDVSKNLLVKPKGYRVVTDFSDTDLKRIVSWNNWDVDIYPVPSGYGSNFIRLRFEHEQLAAITRIRSIEYPLLDLFGKMLY